MTDRFNLTKVSAGERFNLAKAKPALHSVTARLYWSAKQKFDLDLSVFVLKESGNGPKLIGDEWFIFFNQEQSPNNIVVKTPDVRDGGEERATVKLLEIPAEADEISFIATIYSDPQKPNNPLITFGQIEEAGIELIDDSTGEPFLFFDLDADFKDATGVQVASLVREGNTWEFKAVGAGYQLELSDFVNGYV